MGTLITSIGVGVLKSFAVDLLKTAAGEKVQPVDEAVRSTAASFSELEGIDIALQEWLRIPAVHAVVNSFVQGESGIGDLPVSELVSLLVEKTGFYLPEHSAST